jgi:putative FmdB family regulatory protein
MPIYEYVCSACGRRVDVIHGIHGQGPATCEVCGGAMRKALTAPAIHFKGSGWAKKDAKVAPAAASAATTPKEEGSAAGTNDAGTSTGGSSSGVDAPASAPPAPAAPAATPASSGTTGG